jgi:aspartate kinase
MLGGNRMLKVSKFGGTSLSEGKQIKKVAEIIKSDNNRKYIVVSAPGKRWSEDNKITDLLYLCHAHLKYNVPTGDIFKMITDRYSSIVKDLEIDFNLKEHMKEIEKSFNKNISIDYLASRGEYLNALILSKYLNCKFVDSKDIIYFNMDGSLNEEKTEESIRNLLENVERCVIPGFYGTTPLGEIKTFTRGGSDITGSLISRYLNVDIYENWTDVSGFMMADPRIIKNPKKLRNITYQELRELSYMGAKVLHDEAIYPVRKANIPINIRNTNNPDDIGTMITNKKKNGSDIAITGIAGRKDFTVIGLQKFYMNNEVGFVKKLLSILEMYDITFEHIPSGIDTVSIVIDNEYLKGKLEKIIDKIEKNCEPDKIEVFKNIALIAVVGQRMAYTSGISARIFGALGKEKINIRMIDQGSSEINIIIGVKDEDFEKAVRGIYYEFNK